MELACKGYMREPVEELSKDNWPTPYEELAARPMRAALRQVLRACLRFAVTPP
jgi:N-formylglutamate deformylase